MPQNSAALRYGTAEDEGLEDAVGDHGVGLSGEGGFGREGERVGGEVSEAEVLVEEGILREVGLQAGGHAEGGDAGAGRESFYEGGGGLVGRRGVDGVEAEGVVGPGKLKEAESGQVESHCVLKRGAGWLRVPGCPEDRDEGDPKKPEVPGRAIHEGQKEGEHDRGEREEVCALADEVEEG